MPNQEKIIKIVINQDGTETGDTFVQPEWVPMDMNNPRDRRYAKIAAEGMYRGLKPQK